MVFLDLFTCCDLLDELRSIVATLDQQMSPCGQLLGTVHSEHMSVYALLGAWTQAEWQLRVQQRGTFSRSRVDQSLGRMRKILA